MRTSRKKNEIIKGSKSRKKKTRKQGGKLPKYIINKTLKKTLIIGLKIRKSDR